MEKIEKEKKTKSGFLRNSMRGSVRYLALGVFAVLGAAAAAYTVPLVTGFVVDYVLRGDASQLSGLVVSLTSGHTREYWLDNLWIPALVLVGVTLANGVFVHLRQRATAQASEGIAKRMRDTLYTHLQNVPYDYHKHASTGDLVQRCTSDVETVRRFVSTQLLEVVRTVVMVGVALVIMLSLNVRMALISIVTVPFIFGFSFIYFGRVKKRFGEVDEAEGRISTIMQENFSGVRVVRAFGQQRNETDRFLEANGDYRDKTYRLIKMQGMFWGTSDALGYLQILISLAAGIVFAVRGEMTLGNVLIFSSYTSMLVWPVRQLGRVLSDFGKSTVALGRLNEIMDVPEESEPGRALTSEIKGEIEFKDVTFGYDTPDEVLKGISFKVERGQTVAVLGSTGSGKSSLVHLLQRLYTCTGGSIVVDGVDINDIERHWLRKNIGIVLQEPYLYSRTIMENIRITDPSAPDDEVFESARMAAVHDVISGFEKGYDTVVGERGVTLSGGQKQRVAIARMLMQHAPILIFDDSLSAVDTETDSAIRHALETRRRDTTTFIISHRITTLSEADFIIVLEDGRIAERGTHEELLKTGGLYSRIAGIQSLDAEGGDAV